MAFQKSGPESLCLCFFSSSPSFSVPDFQSRDWLEDYLIYCPAAVWRVSKRGDSRLLALGVELHILVPLLGHTPVRLVLSGNKTPGKFLAWPLCRNVSGIFVVYILEDFAGDLPAGPGHFSLRDYGCRIRDNILRLKHNNLCEPRCGVII